LYFSTNLKEAVVGHYAAEMDGPLSNKGELLRKKYWATRTRLEQTSTGNFTILELKEVLRVLKHAPTSTRVFDDNRAWVDENIAAMKKLLRQKPKKKAG